MRATTKIHNGIPVHVTGPSTRLRKRLNMTNNHKFIEQVVLMKLVNHQNINIILIIRTRLEPRINTFLMMTNIENFATHANFFSF